MKVSPIGRMIFLIISITGAFTLHAQNDTISVVSPQTPDDVTDSPVYQENTQLVIPSLFEYVTAPDDLPDLQSRTDYLMDNFWNPFDFKNTKFVDQNALNHAFGVYASAMTFASKKKVEDSVKKLIKNLKGNQGLTIQFTKAAEECLYGPRAEVWADDIYISFLNNFLENKKIDSSKKTKYAKQIDLLKRTSPGAPFPEINLTTTDGTLAKFTPSRDFRLIEFTVPGCDDCRYSNLKMDISGVVNDMIEDGKLDVMVIMTGDAAKAESYSEKWLSMSSDNASEVMDIRFYPCFYIVDKNGKIVAKNQTVDTAIELLETLSQEKK